MDLSISRKSPLITCKPEVLESYWLKSVVEFGNNSLAKLMGNGSLRTVTHPYAVAQDVACACKTILGECIFDTTLGIPYFEKVLGRPVTTSLVIAYLQQEATRLDTVKSATVTLIPDRSARKTTGYITITDTNGTESTLVT